MKVTAEDLLAHIKDLYEPDAELTELELKLLLEWFRGQQDREPSHSIGCVCADCADCDMSLWDPMN